MEERIRTERDLVLQAKSGDLAAYQVLIESHQDSVARIAYRFSNNFHSAEDISQDVFIRAFDKISQYDEAKGAFSSWLFQITKRLALNSRRKFEPASIPFLPDTEDPSDSPSKVADRRDQFKALDRALDQLAEPFRSSFILAEIEELPLSIVAEIENAPEGTIKSRLHRAKQSLRKTLQSEQTRTS